MADNEIDTDHGRCPGGELVKRVREVGCNLDDTKFILTQLVDAVSKHMFGLRARKKMLMRVWCSIPT